MQDRDQLLELIGEIYDCAIAPERWPNTLQLLAEHVGLRAAALNVKNPAQRKVTFLQRWGGNDEYRRLYDAKYFALNPAMTAGWFVDVDEPVTCSGFAGRHEWLRSSMYNEWMKPQNYLDACGINLTKDGQEHMMLSVIRGDDKGWFKDEDLRKLRALSPHVRRAVTISQTVGTLMLRVSDLSTTLDMLRIAVMLLDSSKSIVFANDAAERILSLKDPCRRIHGRLATSNATLSKAIDDTFRQMAGIRVRKAPATSIAIRTSKVDLAIWLLPLDAGLRLDVGVATDAAVAVFIRDSNAGTMLPGELFVRRFGITPAESSVIMMLAQGLSVSDIAAALGISEPTVRTHLQHLFRKTGTAKQTQLVGLVAEFVSPVRY
jgi:DNA-binding CsgD family transcriptional regulator